MIIRSIKLENIRSYTSQKIDFPEGSVLLSGDIGSGKSSILLALDFALFGLGKGSNNAAGLLRNGEDKGKVELLVDIDGKIVNIVRTLKRMQGITQDYGSINVDGDEKELTVLELRQAILDLLNYPKELLTKSKSLIYKYTVYTPQEEMKSILTEDNELRLDTLRKVFNVDKYKRIRDNAKIMIDALRSRKNEMNARILDLQARRDEKEKMQARFDEAFSQLANASRELEKINSEVMYKKEWMNKIESDVRKHNEIIGKLNVNNVRIEHARKRLEEANLEHIQAENDIIEMNSRIKSVKIEESRSLLESKNIEINSVDSSVRDLNNMLGEINANLYNANNTKSRILELSICPVCSQNVSEEYKNNIARQADEKITEHSSKQAHFRLELGRLESNLVMLKKDIDKIGNAMAEHKLIERKMEERQIAKTKNLSIISQANDEIARLAAEDSMLRDSLASYKDSENSFRQEREIMDVLMESQRKLYGKKASLDAESKMISDLISRLDKEIILKEGIQARLGKLDNVRGWLEQDFTNMIEAMERSVMLRIYSEFDSMFRKWVEMLIGDENIRIRLDEEFSPKTEQNGHDIEYEYLSGGEKTAVALAYRLALNQVINSIVSQVRTKDLIILDEPTDGFSDQQLERMRDVLQELKVKQLIIVSHESKIESFVDSIIRIRKQDHVSHASI